MRIELTIMLDMCDFLHAFPVAFIEKIAAKVFVDGMAARLVGCGVNCNTVKPLISVQEFAESKEAFCRQMVELEHSPFSAERGGVSGGLEFMLSSPSAKRDARQLVFVVSNMVEASYGELHPLVERLRESGVFVRFISPGKPESVIAAIRARTGGYVT